MADYWPRAEEGCRRNQSSLPVFTAEDHGCCIGAREATCKSPLRLLRDSDTWSKLKILIMVQNELPDGTDAEEVTKAKDVLQQAKTLKE